MNKTLIPFKENDFIVSDRIPEICILYGYNKMCKIKNIKDLVKISDAKYLIADIEIMENKLLEKEIFIPLYDMTILIEDFLYINGKKLFVNSLSRLEKIFLKKLIENNSVGEKTLLSNISSPVYELLNQLLLKSIKFFTIKNTFMEEKYLPLINIKKHNQTSVIYDVPVLDYLSILMPYNNTIINKDFTTLVKDLKKEKKKIFDKAIKKEFII